MSLKTCENLGSGLRYSQCINIDTRMIIKEATHECCKETKGRFDGKSKLCINDAKSDYGICCMKYTNKNEFVGIWSNFTLVDGIMFHENHQVNCLKNRHEKSKPKHLPHEDNKIKTSYYDLD